MSREGSLFERLLKEPDASDPLDRESCVMRSVSAHLGKMLSVRVGSVQTVPDYGLPDLNDMKLSLNETLTQARVAIEALIQRYEPRLTDVVVTAFNEGNDPLRRAFGIKASLEVGGVKRAVKFTANLGSSGEVRVIHT